jgi:hypothetical protein
MKYTLISFLLFISALFFIGSCSDGVSPTDGTTLPKIDTFDCPLPKVLQGGTGGYANPPSILHHLQRRSADGSKIAYLVYAHSIRVLDIKTGTEQEFKLSKMLPPEIRFSGCFDICWCPYDNAKLAFTGVTYIGGVFAENLFILSTKQSTIDIIDLPFASTFGVEGGIWINGWLNGSTPASDSIFLNYGSGSSTIKPYSIRGIVVLQEKKIVLIPQVDKLLKEIRYADFLYSADKKHLAALKPSGGTPYFAGVYIDGERLPLSDTINLINYASWSPDGKKLAVSVELYRGQDQVIIIDVDKWLRERPAILQVEKIDYRKRFCMYMLSGEGTTDAEFLTNTTLAVSMHHDGDMISPLWEITTDGRLLRQLTK